MSLNCAADLSELESLLAEHMHPSGVSRELHAELETARRLRDEEATRFAQSRQLEEALEELLQEDSVPGAGKALAALHSLLSRARAAQYLREDGVVLGVDPPAVLSSAHREERALVQRLVVPLLEQRLQERARRVADFAGADSLDKLAAEARVAQKTALTERQELEALRQETVRAEIALLGHIGDLVLRLRMDSTAQQAAQTELRWLAAQADGMASKAALLEKRMLRETYHSANVVTALERLRNNLVQAVEAAESRRAKLQMRKEQFAEGGEPLAQAARDYAALQAAVRETQWALSELNA